MATLVGTSPSRPVWLVADAVNVNASADSTAYMVDCHGFDWAYIEVDFSKQYNLFAVGHSGYGSSDHYFQVDPAGALATRSNIAGGSPYSMKLPCANLQKVGGMVHNTDAALAGTLTMRITLSHV